MFTEYEQLFEVTCQVNQGMMSKTKPYTKPVYAIIIQMIMHIREKCEPHVIEIQ